MVEALRPALFKLDNPKGADEKAKRGLRVLKSFAGTIKLRHGESEISIGAESEPGVADSGSLARDLEDLFIAAGEAAKSHGSAIVLLIDEIQNLSRTEIGAFLKALHRVNQKLLPIMIFGAGLPSFMKLAGSAKAYAERLFDYRKINWLDEPEARRALVMPAAGSNVEFSDDAVAEVFRKTRGYPYFLQEWGYHAWNAAEKPPIGIHDISKASREAISHLDGAFFPSRYCHLPAGQKEYALAMAKLGPGPCDTAEVAKLAGKAPRRLEPTREALIEKGVIHSPGDGMAAFTAPLFDEFIRRVEGLNGGRVG